MIKRLRKGIVAVAALAALAAGGSAIAQAAGTSTVKPASVETTTAPDRDNVGSGDDYAAEMKSLGFTYAYISTSGVVHPDRVWTGSWLASMGINPNSPPLTEAQRKKSEESHVKTKSGYSSRRSTADWKVARTSW